MNFKEAEARAAELKELLNKWNHEYYINNEPSVDDSVFDLHLAELVKIEAEFPVLLTEDSPTQNVGSDLNNDFTKKKHPYRKMLSLSNAFSYEDLIKFDKRVKDQLGKDADIQYTVEPKIDGISMSIHYSNGKLVEALTRGDGETGELVTSNIMQINDVPKEIPFKGDINVRGEVYMSNKTFENLNNARLANEEQLFANPRNATAGTMRQIDSNVVKERELSMFVYSAYTSEGVPFSSQTETLKSLIEMGFQVSDLSATVSNIEEVIETVENLEKVRPELDFEIDGVVLKVDDVNLHEQVGSTAKFPRWATAYKFPAEVKETKLIDIWPTVGRTGRITYNAKLEPVQLVGTTVQAATLHNAEYIKALDLRVGDTVKVKKAGDIIPKVIESNHDSGNDKWETHHNCPVCNTELIKYDGEVDQYCLNPTCPAKIKEQFIHFVSRDGMNIEGLAEKQVELFINLGYISSFADIYRLSEKKEQILELEGYQDKSVEKLLASIEKSKENSLEKLLFALGIRNIGKKTSLELSMMFNDVKQLIEITSDELESKSDFGEVKAKSITDWFAQDENKKLLQDLMDLGINTKYKGEEVIKTMLTGQTVVVTGGIVGGTRDDVKALLVSYGANVATSPSQKTNYLFVGKGASEAKIDKASKATIIRVETIEDIKNYVKRR